MIDTLIIRLLYAAQMMIFMIFWYLLKRRFKKKAPLISVFYLLQQCILVNLSYRDWLPEFMLNPDKKTEDQKILLALITSHCINYNTFLVTMIVNPILTLVAAYLSLKA